MEKDVIKWAEDATIKLEKAQEIGASANSCFNETKMIIQGNNRDLIKGNFMLDSINQQLQLLETIYESIELNIEEKVHSIDILSSYLNNTIEEMETEFDELKGIKVDKAFNSNQDNLYQFVSHEVLDDLKDEFDNMDHYFKNLLQTLEGSLKTMRLDLNKFNDSFGVLDKEIASFENIEWITNLIEETNSFENELALLIGSITNHYDQCSKALDIIENRNTDEVSEEEKLELFDVVSKDFEEVPEVINDIEEVYCDIKTRCKRITDFFEKRSYDKKLKSLSSSLDEYGNQLTLIMTTLSKHTALFLSKVKEVNTKCDESNELIKHYQKFSKSYYSLIIEVNRRRQVQDKMHKIFIEANNKMKSLQEEDNRFRSSFINNNNFFLPRDLWEGFDDDSPLVQITTKYTEIPQISEATLNKARDILNKRN